MRYVIPAIVGTMYAAQGVYHLWKGEAGFTIMWLAYSIANFGIILAMSEGKE